MIKPSPRHAEIATLTLLGLICGVALWRIIGQLGLTMPLDPNEGWNAYHTMAAMRGGDLYPGPEAYLVNNYPPLSYYVVGFVSWFTGDVIVAGRVVSLLAVAWVLVAMGLIARRFGVKPLTAVAAPLLFLTGLVLFTDYVGMDDPQMLAHAVSVGGFFVLLQKRPHRFTLPATAALFVLAFFVKHAVIVLPMAATLWLVLSDRRKALILAGYGIGFAVLGLIAFRLAYGVDLWSVVNTARTYSLDMLTTGLLGWLRFAALPLIGLGILLWQAPRDPIVRFCALYAGIGTAIGIYFIGGAGVDPNVLFDADIALCLTTALLLQRLQGWIRPAALVIVAAPLFVHAASDRDWQMAYLDFGVVHYEATIAQSDIAFMTAQKGPGLCEMLSFCYWSGKPPAVDAFNIGQAFETGARSDAEITAKVDAKYYAVIQFDPGEPYALGENVYQALMRAYRLHHSDDYGSFYVPK